MVQLPLRLDWTERVEFHLDDPAERNVMYERVIREATRPEDLRSYLNGAVLRETWRQLFLPARVLWFAEALAAVDRLPVRLFEPYGVTPDLASALKRRMSQWAREIRSVNHTDGN